MELLTVIVYIFLIRSVRIFVGVFVKIFRALPEISQIWLVPFSAEVSEVILCFLFYMRVFMGYFVTKGF